MKPPLTDADFRAAAALLGCDVAAIRAVTDVEAPRGAFLPTGEPTLLYERHRFSRLTNGRFDGARAPGLPERYSLISWPTAGGYGPESAQHARLQAAVALDRAAALKSASWGMFQIMGQYHAEAGHPELQDFVNAMYKSAAEHLRAFVSLIISRRLTDELREHRWADLARRYNGKGYRKNQYDTKLAAAHARHRAERAERA
jgi:hypothetical protein